MFANTSTRLLIRIPNLVFSLCCLFASAAFAQSPGNGAPPPLPPPASTATGGGANPTPVEQALVPEGVYAMQLVDALNLGTAADQAKAEELMSNLGIEPKNGWISEYPVTPAVLGELDKGIAAACDQGKIPLTKDQALKRTGELKTRLGFEINPGPNPPSPLSRQRPASTKIYSYTDKNGAKYYTDDYDSIPTEYRDKAKVVSQSAPSALAGMPGVPPDWQGPQNTATPNPNAIYDYYQNQGPPAVTYYPPPQPYYYLYSWVPYPFWSTGYYFPGFFVLNNFHRQVHYNQNPYYASHHVGPVHAGSAMPSGAAASGWYPTPGAQAGARGIVSLQQNGAAGTAHMQPWQERRPYLPAANPAFLANSPSLSGNRPMVNHHAVQPAPYAGARFYNQAPAQPSYAPHNYGYSSPPAFEEHHFINAPQAFGGGSGAGHFAGHAGVGGGGGGARGGGRH